MVSKQTRNLVRNRARNRCEYCHSPEFVSGSPFTIDHILPQSLGGSDDSNNLALACHRCNERHYNFTTGIDPVTQQECPLFHPRQQQWNDHFIWMIDRKRILGTTEIGRATCDRFDLNDDFHNDGFIQEARRYWIVLGCHPPSEDSIQA